jgi:type IV fimbrial biogenesis protein FimT
MKQRIQRSDSVKGFTLVELLVTISVAMILLAVAVPRFREMLAGYQLNTQANDFISNSNFAKSEAIRLGRRVTLCPSTNGADCAAVDWEQGWIIFDDPDNDATRDAGETLLAVHAALPAGATMTGNANVDSYISFTADGTARLMNSTAFQSGTVTLCQQNRALGYAIVLSSTGRVRVDTVNNCP